MRVLVGVQFRNQNGSSLVMVLVAAFMLGGLSLFVAEVFRQQAKVQRALAQKYEMMDAKNTLMSLFSNPNICSCNLKKNLPLGASGFPSINANLPDNSATANDESTPIEYSEIKAGCDAGSPVFLSTANDGALGSITGMKVESIRLKNFLPTTLPAADALDWKANWIISYKRESLEMESQPVVVTQLIKVLSTAENAQSIPDHRMVKACIGNVTRTVYNGAGAQLSCYDIRVDDVQPSSSNQVTSMDYHCSGEGNGGIGAAEPGAYLMAVSCSGNPGLLENLTGIGGITCVKPNSVDTFIEVSNRVLKMLCCKFNPE